jgi:hypothetical protein
MLETLVAVAPSTAFDGELPDDIVRLLADMRRWSARVGAELASAWSFVAAHVSHSAIRDVQAATTYLADLRASLVNIAKALLAGGASAATKAIASARVAMEGVQQALDGLAQSLQDNGFDPTHPW